MATVDLHKGLGMAVLNSRARDVSARGRTPHTAFTEQLATIEDDLRATEAILTSEGRDVHGDAVRLLKAVEDALLTLACASSTEPSFAAHLVDVRDELSSYLLAAAVVAEAGGGTAASTDVIRRAVTATMSALKPLTR